MAVGVCAEATMDEAKKTADGRRRWEHWTEDQARASLEELAQSGVSMQQFAQNKGVSTQRIAYWKKRLAEGGATTFIAVPLSIRTRPEESLTMRHLEIAVGRVAIRIREDLDVERLVRIIGALARETA